MPPKIVFVTGYENMYNAWEAKLWIIWLKPYRKRDIRYAIERCKSSSRPAMARWIEVKCFLGFELFLDKDPVKFHNKAKELLGLFDT